MAKWRRDPVIAYGVPMAGGFMGFASQGNTWWVNGESGSDHMSGRSHTKSLKTISKAVERAVAGDLIMVAPSEYDETVIIPMDKPYLSIVGMGAWGSPWINPSDETAAGMLIYPKECQIVNLGVGGGGKSTAAVALRIWGASTRIIRCKIEGAAAACILGPGTFEQQAAGTHGDAGNVIFDDCEFAWCVNGIVLQSPGDPSVTQTRIRNCHFHNCSGTCIDEYDVGTNAGVRDVWIVGNTFCNRSSAAEPTSYIDMDQVGTTGFVCGNYFATTVFAAAKIALAAGVIFAGNYAQAESGSGTPDGTAGRPD